MCRACDTRVSGAVREIVYTVKNAGKSDDEPCAHG